MATIVQLEQYHIELYIPESGLHVFLNVMGPVLANPFEWIERNYSRWLTYTTEHERRAWAEREARVAEIEEHYQWALNVAYAEGG